MPQSGNMWAGRNKERGIRLEQRTVCNKSSTETLKRTNQNLASHLPCTLLTSNTKNMLVITWKRG